MASLWMLVSYLLAILALNYWLSDRPPGALRVSLPFFIAIAGTLVYQYGVLLASGQRDKFIVIAAVVQFVLSVVVGFVGIAIRSSRRAKQPLQKE